MIKLEGFLKRSWPNFKVLSRNSPEGTEENQEVILISDQFLCTISVSTDRSTGCVIFSDITGFRAVDMFVTVNN
jgi:hypothetical protein